MAAEVQSYFKVLDSFSSLVSLAHHIASLYWTAKKRICLWQITINSRKAFRTMASFFAKNALQEIYQRKKEALPVYSTILSDYGWQSTVTLASGKSFQGSCMTSKKAAELDVAEFVLRLEESKDSANVAPPLKDSFLTAVIVDAEHFLSLIRKIVPHKNSNIYVFLGQHHDLINTTFPLGITKIVNSSHRRDNECFIQMYTGWLLAEGKYDKYIFVTDERLACSLARLTTSSSSPWQGRASEVAFDMERLNYLLDGCKATT